MLVSFIHVTLLTDLCVAVCLSLCVCPPSCRYAGTKLLSRLRHLDRMTSGQCMSVCLSVCLCCLSCAVFLFACSCFCIWYSRNRGLPLLEHVGPCLSVCPAVVALAPGSSRVQTHTRIHTQTHTQTYTRTHTAIDILLSVSALLHICVFYIASMLFVTLICMLLTHSANCTEMCGAV